MKRQIAILLVAALGFAASATLHAETDEKLTKRITRYIEDLDKWDTDDCREASDKLAKIGKPAVPALIETLSSKTTKKRRFAARALREIGQDAAEAIPALAEMVEDRDKEAREYAVEALGRMVDQADEVLPLMDKFRDDNKKDVRKTAARWINRLKTARDERRALAQQTVVVTPAPVVVTPAPTPTPMPVVQTPTPSAPTPPPPPVETVAKPDPAELARKAYADTFAQAKRLSPLEGIGRMRWGVQPMRKLVVDLPDPNGPSRQALAIEGDLFIANVAFNHAVTPALSTVAKADERFDPKGVTADDFKAFAALDEAETVNQARMAVFGDSQLFAAITMYQFSGDAAAASKKLIDDLVEKLGEPASVEPTDNEVLITWRSVLGVVVVPVTDCTIIESAPAPEPMPAAPVAAAGSVDADHAIGDMVESDDAIWMVDAVTPVDGDLKDAQDQAHPSKNGRYVVVRFQMGSLLPNTITAAIAPKIVDAAGNAHPPISPELHATLAPAWLKQQGLADDAAKPYIGASLMTGLPVPYIAIYDLPATDGGLVFQPVGLTEETKDAKRPTIALVDAPAAAPPKPVAPPSAPKATEDKPKGVWSVIDPTQPMTVNKQIAVGTNFPTWKAAR